MKDGRQSDRALMVQSGVIRHFQNNGIALLAEFTLANNMRADLIGVSQKGRILIIEIKSSIEDFKVDQKWPNYREFCDEFYFASHAGVSQDIFPDDEGFILADQYGAEILRPAVETKLVAATRKALTLRLARAACLRLERVIQFANSSGVLLPDELEGENGD